MILLHGDMSIIWKIKRLQWHFLLSRYLNFKMLTLRLSPFFWFGVSDLAISGYTEIWYFDLTLLYLSVCLWCKFVSGLIHWVFFYLKLFELYRCIHLRQKNIHWQWVLVSLMPLCLCKSYLVCVCLVHCFADCCGAVSLASSLLDCQLHHQTPLTRALGRVICCCIPKKITTEFIVFT